MNYRNYKKSRDAALQILIDCNVQCLPVNLNQICKHLGIKTYSYFKGKSILTELDLLEASALTDGMSLLLGDTPVVLYNSDEISEGRMRFTVTHEIGHIILGHLRANDVTVINREPSSSDNPFETAANQFAARLLAPACVLWGLGVHTPEDIANVCNISITAATFRAERMEELYKRNRFLASPLERAVYAQFLPYINESIPQSHCSAD